jgi:hypothetical protein
MTRTLRHTAAAHVSRTEQPRANTAPSRTPAVRDTKNVQLPSLPSVNYPPGGAGQRCQKHWQPDIFRRHARLAVTKQASPAWHCPAILLIGGRVAKLRGPMGWRRSGGWRRSCSLRFLARAPHLQPNCELNRRPACGRRAQHVEHRLPGSEHDLTASDYQKSVNRRASLHATRSNTMTDMDVRVDICGRSAPFLHRFLPA